MKKLLVVLAVAVLLPAEVLAFAVNVDGANVNVNGQSVSVDGPNGSVQINPDQITVTGENGQAVITENNVSVTADGVPIEESGSGQPETEETNNSVSVDADDIGGISTEGLGFYSESEVEAADTKISFVRMKDNNVVVNNNGQECSLSVGVQAVKSSCPDNSVIVYYAESGIESSDMRIGNKSKGLYLKTDFGQVKINNLPNGIYQNTVVGRGHEVERVEFGWDSAGQQLMYIFKIKKQVKLLGLIPVTVVVSEHFDVVSGARTVEDKTWRNRILDWLSF